MSAPLIGRGYAVVYQGRDGVDRVTAAVSGPVARDLRRRVGGVIVNVAGQPYRYAQQRQVRALLASPAELRALPVLK